ncbi:SRPBCC family protein [Oerskovia flava]|uniref:SRPBCC family protein n=1 Tax=Oerskovia flava TaxID=2986422 RepID=UPI00223FA84C|nr:SRPBCC family protein [Oerskovia sp. JB1-3-2]
MQTGRGRERMSGLSVEQQEEFSLAMKYTNSIEIALPRERVAQLLADPVHLPMWLRGVVLHEPVKGMHGQLGTTSRVVMQSGKREMELLETITRRDPVDLHGIPRDVVVHFDRETVGPGMWSDVRDQLTEATPETTLWKSDSEYRFSGLLMRLMGRVMPGAFHKQSQQHMEDFKAFAEHGKDVRDG